ncbi:hypothetical protein [Phytohabitans houttuyneae]|uniref:DUF4386 domain-containing protein n=1 Tax=Phytohabitans houttuyneae TaxID=1076126 RepID=A0A6V8KQI5_9ACTN|nr:hypothetical protein [Phytohabitans houttuyneae]GFJ84126.1 hypothetical protein Phou_083060 [Phytohabitans houttuyneae]
MSTTWLLRFGAACGVVLGLSTAVPGLIEAFTGETAATSFVIGLGAAFGAPALTALYLRQRTESGRFGAVAYAVNLIGLGLFAGVAFALNLVLFYVDEAVADEVLAGPTRFAVLGSALVFVTGTVLFAVSMVRTRVLPVLPAAGYGLAFTLLALLAPLPDSPLTSAVHVLAGGSLIWLSVALRAPVPIPTLVGPAARAGAAPPVRG